MELRTLLVVFLIAVIYPVWLVAGFFDYVIHRKTDIEHTSGSAESRFHLAQFSSLAVVFMCATLLKITPLVFVILVGAVVVHTVLAVQDVSYAEGLRYISPHEQLVHGFMSVLPIVAVGVIAVLNWTDILTSPWALRLKHTPIPWRQTALLLGSFAVLAGVPILEKLVRTSRGLGDHQVGDDDQRRKGHAA